LDGFRPYDTMAIEQGDERCGLAWTMENAMTTAWTKTLALGLLVWPLGCVVSVDDDPNDGFGGNGGVSGRGGDSGSSGTGGSAGDSAGGTGGDTAFPAPTCDAEPQDENDECVQCFKQNCCTEWVECDDQTCTDEWIDVAECTVMTEFATSEDLGMCISESSASADGFVQPNTQALIDCALSPADDSGIDTLCSSECFGTDIFVE
jgi:hypothetical protein